MSMSLYELYELFEYEYEFLSRQHCIPRSLTD